MSLIKAKEYLTKYGLENKIMEFDVSSATVKEAAKAINCKEGEIVKTLSFIVNDIPILIAVAGDSKIDNSKFKEEFQTKIKNNEFIEYEHIHNNFYGSSFKVFDEYLQKGKNTITLQVRSSLRNLFGPHHFAHNPEPMGVAPTTFTFRGDWTDEGCIDYTDAYNFVPFGVDAIQMIDEK